MSMERISFLATGLALGVSTLTPGLTSAETNKADHANQAAIAANGLTRKIADGQPIPIDGNKQVVWTPPKSRYTFGNVTGIEVLEKVAGVETFFQLDVQGKTIVAEPIPEQDVMLQIASPLVYQGGHPAHGAPLEVTSNDVVVKLIGGEPMGEVRLSNGNEEVVGVAVTRIIKSNFITA
jgi:hypothetical protein